MIATRNLSFNYNTTTGFNFPDLQCHPSETLLIVGGSGKGKTTLLHLLGGLLRPENGDIFIDGSNLNELSNEKLDHFRGKNIGLVLQQSYFISSLNVLENLELSSWLSDKKKKSEKAQALLQQLDLKDQMHKLPSKLSIGQQQRVSIARALINEPKLLLADEPTSSLDDENAYKVADLLSELSKKYNASLIIVTHDQRLKDRFPNQISL